jgi:putative nucleotidyltransferase with HDIG domain
MKTARAFYRVRQLRYAARARVAEQDYQFVARFLTPQQFTLFDQMQPAEQVHSLQVARELLELGEDSPDLLAAALLHDVGKMRQPLQLWERIWIVLGETLFPALVHRWGNTSHNSGPASFLWRPFMVAERHPQWGAELALQAGASPLTADLIRRHHTRIEAVSRQTLTFRSSLAAPDRLLGLLQSVDDES